MFSCYFEDPLVAAVSQTSVDVLRKRGHKDGRAIVLPSILPRQNSDQNVDSTPRNQPVAQ